MKSNLRVRYDRVSTWEELDEVITLLADLHPLPLETALDFVGRADTPSSRDDTEMWIEASGDESTRGGIESLANIIVGRRDRPN